MILIHESGIRSIGSLRSSYHFEGAKIVVSISDNFAAHQEKVEFDIAICVVEDMSSRDSTGSESPGG